MKLYTNISNRWASINPTCLFPLTNRRWLWWGFMTMVRNKVCWNCMILRLFWLCWKRREADNIPVYKADMLLCKPIVKGKCSSTELKARCPVWLFLAWIKMIERTWKNFRSTELKFILVLGNKNMDRMLYFLLTEKLTFFRKENRNLIEWLSLLLRGEGTRQKTGRSLLLG